jgi:hypothetical protein
MNAVHNLASYFLKISFNIICQAPSFKLSFTCSLSYQNLAHSVLDMIILPHLQSQCWRSGRGVEARLCCTFFVSFSVVPLFVNCKCNYFKLSPTSSAIDSLSDF